MLYHPGKMKMSDACVIVHRHCDTMKVWRRDVNMAGVSRRWQYEWLTRYERATRRGANAKVKEPIYKTTITKAKVYRENKAQGAAMLNEKRFCAYRNQREWWTYEQIVDLWMDHQYNLLSAIG